MIAVLFFFLSFLLFFRAFFLPPHLTPGHEEAAAEESFLLGKKRDMQSCTDQQQALHYCPRPANEHSRLFTLCRPEVPDYYRPLGKFF